MRGSKFHWFLLWLGAASGWSAEVIPPAPKDHFNDYANVVSAATAADMNRTLEDFERQTSSQIVVAVLPRMQSGSSLEDYTRRVAETWKVGQQRTNNGAVLFVFVQDRRVRIEVGYGLEGALPDATAKRIIEDEIVPRFRRGDYEGGLRAGVTAILQAVRGEYQGTGRTARRHMIPGATLLYRLFWGIVILAFIFSFLIRFVRSRGGTVYRRSGRDRYWIGWPGGGGSGGGSGGGGFSGGSFGGGGGSFGGGGASGSW
jgi:uncharacterized protein